MKRDYISKTKRLLLLLALYTYCLDSLQSNPHSVRLYFNQGDETIIYSDSIERFISTIKLSRDSIEHVNIEGYCSPEGSTVLNNELSRKRCESAKEILTYTLNIPDSIINIEGRGIAWKQLEDITHNLPSATSIDEDIYPQLRYADITLHFAEREDKDESKVSPPKIEPHTTPQEEFITKESTSQQIAIDSKPLLALKTNLLFDAASLINFEIEVPIKDRWSIAIEYICPWWVMDNGEADSRRNRIQLLNGNIEGRYWWGEREGRPLLTGWFTGIYAGVGLYDFEHKAKGYQGDFMLSAGVSGGYAHPFKRNENLRMEYSLSVGYMESDYTYYHSEFCNNSVWHAVEQRSGRYRWFGPTRAKVSLVWLINKK